MKSWDEVDTTPRFRLLKTRPCSQSELIAKSGESSYGFFPIDKAGAATVQGSNKFKCINEPYDIYGDYNSYRT